MNHQLYNCHAIPTGWRITKFDPSLNVVGTYEITAEDPPTCTCPGWPRKRICKHTRMLNTFALAGAIDTDRFYDYERQMWHQPIPPSGEPPMKDKLDAFNAAMDVEAASSESPEPEIASTQPAPAPEPPKSTGIRRL